jgi:hypothetical protein
MGKFQLNILGERINPGFKSTRALFDNEDFAGIQALAVKQVEAGAFALNVNVGNRAVKDPQFMAEVIRAIQSVVSVPLSFDFPGAETQEVCPNAMIRKRRRACSHQFHRRNALGPDGSLKIRPFQVVVGRRQNRRCRTRPGGDAAGKGYHASRARAWRKSAA